MITQSHENIKEIAENLDMSFRAFIHRTNGALLFIPGKDAGFSPDDGGWEEELEELENNLTEYLEIEKWTSGNAFRMNVEFTKQLTSPKSVQTLLFEALEMRKPFKQFRAVLDQSGDVLQEWYVFKSNWQQNYVEQWLKEETMPKNDEESEEEE